MAARQARATFGDPDADGWVPADVPIESIGHGQHALLQLGEHVEVLGPPELRERMAASARALAASYGADSGG